MQISFVRSLESDDLDLLQLKMLEIGGNEKFIQFIKLFMIPNEGSDRHSKYFRRACDLYRRKLAQCAELNIEFIVNESWFDQITLTEGNMMLQ